MREKGHSSMPGTAGTSQPDESSGSNGADGSAANASGSAQQHRLSVLHDLALQARPLERPATPVAPAVRPERSRTTPAADRRAIWRRSRRQRIVTTGISLLVLAVVAAGALRFAGVNPFARSTTAAPSGPLTIALAATGIGCPNDVTWSPQSTAFAVVGSQGCGQQPSSLQIYDAATGKVRRTIRLDQAVQKAVAQVGGTGSIDSFQLQELLWSPRGQLAALFVVGYLGPAAGFQNYRGIVLVNELDGTLQVFVQPVPFNSYQYYVKWDVTSGKGAVVPDAVAGDQYAFATVFPGLAYAWGFNDDLYVAEGFPDPSNPSAPATLATDPIGNPVTDKFSIWQDGDITLTQGATAKYPLWFTYFGAWSPDGSVIVDSVTVNGLLYSVGQPAPDLSGLGDSPLKYAPLMPVRDAGMQAVLANLQAANTPAAATGAAQIAWRPDGKMLATMPDQGPAGQVPAAHAVTIYSCATGKVLATLHAPPSRGSGQPTGTSVLRWSPDGSHLLLVDPVLHVVAIWGPSMLPK